MRTVLKLLPLSLLCALGPGLPGCNTGEGVLLAKRIESRGELVGGPVAMADVGDYLLQNDQIKVAIFGPHDSQGPGVFGGSIVDVDINRDRLEFVGAQGHDRFAELFPVANLLSPAPDPSLMQVSVLEDGSNGQEAAIRVTGVGTPLFEALGILHTDVGELRSLFPQVKTAFSFVTDYIVHPGERHVLIRTTLTLLDQAADPTTCPTDPSTCDASQCPSGLAGDPTMFGCFTCDCANPLPLDLYTQPVSVFDQIFGSDMLFSTPPPMNQGGVVAGDFVFFGAENDVFAPGAGFDTDKLVHDAYYAGMNTFQHPFSFDFVSAAGGDVSYGYFTVASPGDPPPVVNMPLFTSAATAFLSAGKTCLISDPACAAARVFTYERYLAVGAGDVGSVSDEAWKTRGTPVGSIQGTVLVQETGAPAAQAHVYFFTNPAPGKSWGSVDEIAAANQLAGGYGLVDAADADLTLPVVPQGSYGATIPPGDYVVVARTQDGMGFSVPQSVHVDAGATVVVNPTVVTPGSVQYRIVDETGAATPVKVALVSLDANGNPLPGDGLRRVYLGDSRLGNGVRAIDYSPTGEGQLTVEPGKYRFRASRGPEYSIYEQDFTIGASGVQIVSGSLTHEVDTTGWMSADMHLHATLSFDSGMPLPQRVATTIDEGVELGVSTDHDFETDYDPTIRSMLVEPFLATAIGAETTTIEQGHFISFPLRYDQTIVPTNGSHDPTCQSGGEILDALRQIGSDPSYLPFTIVAHPRDGFFGYAYQLGVDPYTMQRKVSSLEATNPVFQTASCDFDAMEVINGKRLDLMRTPTVEEVVDWNRCLTAFQSATTVGSLVGICPDVLALATQKGMAIPPGMQAPPSQPLVPCTEGEPFATCLSLNRTAYAWLAMRNILYRTPEEQATNWNFAMTAVGAQPMCNVAQYGDAAVPPTFAGQPCTYYLGQVDDYFFYLEHGLVKTMVASSDSHEGIHEPGYPRTFFQSPTDSPVALTTADAVESLRAHHAVTSYGPFVRATIGGKTFGSVVAATGGGTVAMDLSVETASWFGVDRIEIYENGLLVRAITPTSQPQDIVDYQGTVTLPVPAGRDSWIVVIAMGLGDGSLTPTSSPDVLMRPVSRDIPYGEIQLSLVAAQAFSLIPVVNTVITAPPLMPDWFPIPAYAVTNAIFLDTNGNGQYDAPLPFPAWCSATCDPGASTSTCPSGQTCIAGADGSATGLCGYPVTEQCTYRYAWEGGGP